MTTDNYSLTLVTGPLNEPVTTAEAKLAARIQSTSEDSLVESLLKAAREQVEADTDLKLMPQTWLLTLDGWPEDGEIEMPITPVSAVAVNYLDVNDASQLWGTSNYYTDLKSVPPRILLAPNKSWPALSQKKCSVLVTITAGFANAAAVPERAKQAIKLLVGHWYQNRELATDRNTKSVEFAYQALTIGLRRGFV